MVKADPYDIYLEVGQKKVFACSMDWPGWCRSGRDEGAAIQALLDAAPRYRSMLEQTPEAFVVPQSSTDLTITERVKGSAATDFGAPGASIRRDQDHPDFSEVERYKVIFKASWMAFDQAVRSAQEKELRKGPRGGGRELAAIIAHVAEADLGYLNSLGWKVKIHGSTTPAQQLDLIRSEILRGIDAAAAGQLAQVGPRGGRRWSLRFFVRYATWHVVDHTWEIEDRVILDPP